MSSPSIASFDSKNAIVSQPGKATVSNTSPAGKEYISLVTPAPINTDKLNSPSLPIPNQPVTSVTNVTDISKEEPPEVKAAREFVVKTIKELASFFPELNEENKNQIFLLNEEGNVTLGNNEMETFDVSDLTTEASHEAAKEKFFKLLEQFYDPAVVAVLCPEKEGAAPLTPVLAVALNQQCVDFHKGVVNSCQGDLSKYPEQLQTQLEVYKKVQEIMIHPPEPSTGQLTLIDSLTKYTGFSSTMLYAGLLVGGVVATSAVSGGAAAIPSLLHFASTSAMAHGSVLGATLSSVTSHTTAMGAAHLTGGITAHSAGATVAQHGMGVGAEAARHEMHLRWMAFTKSLYDMAFTTGVGAALGGVIGGMVGGTIGGINGGMGGIYEEDTIYHSRDDLGHTYRTDYASPGLPGAAMGAAMGIGTGVVIGEGIGALLGGLSVIFNCPIPIGGPMGGHEGYSAGSLNIAATLIAAGLLGGLAGGDQRTGALGGAGIGIGVVAALTSSSLAFGSVCHILAASWAAGTITAPAGALLSIGGQTATAVGSGALSYYLASNSPANE